MVLEVHGLLSLSTVKDGLFWHVSAHSICCICSVILQSSSISFFSLYTLAILEGCSYHEHPESQIG